MSGRLRSILLFSGLAVALTAACYDYSLPTSREEATTPRPTRDGGRVTETGTVEDATAPSPDDDVVVVEEDAGTSCAIGATHCGGTKIDGRADTLYRCTADGGEVVARCANNCANDACNPPTPCVVGGSYCGGDKINGDPDVLYLCRDANGQVDVVQRCPNGCQWNPGRDDTCI